MKKLFAFILAALAFTACSTDDEYSLDYFTQKYGNNGNSEKEEPKAEVKDERKLTTKQVLTIRNMCNNHEMPEENVYKMYGRASIAEMTQEDWGHFGKIGQEMFAKWDEEHGNEGERTA